MAPPDDLNLTFPGLLISFQNLDPDPDPVSLRLALGIPRTSPWDPKASSLTYQGLILGILRTSPWYAKDWSLLSASVVIWHVWCVWLPSSILRIYKSSQPRIIVRTQKKTDFDAEGTALSIHEWDRHHFSRRAFLHLFQGLLVPT